MVRYSLILFYFLQLCLRSKIGGKTAPAPWSKVGPHQSHPYLGINVNVNFNVTQSHSISLRWVQVREGASRVPLAGVRGSSHVEDLQTVDRRGLVSWRGHWMSLLVRVQSTPPLYYI